MGTDVRAVGIVDSSVIYSNGSSHSFNEVECHDNICESNAAYEEYIAHMEEDYGSINHSILTSPLDVNMLSDDARVVRAGVEIDMARSILDNPLVDGVARVEWQTAFDRLNDIPNPTESNSGSYTRQEQIDYSEAHNPRHWNLVKVRYNGRTSGYYLTYLCPPSLTLEHDIRTVGGIHENDEPNAFGICVYNTEEYWRELRHTMHQNVETFREVRAA